MTTKAANDMLVYAVGITVATTVNVPAGFTQQWSTTSTSSTTSEMSQEVFPPLAHGYHSRHAQRREQFQYHPADRAQTRMIRHQLTQKGVLLHYGS